MWVDYGVAEKVYHVYSRSIANFKIFNSDPDFLRMREAICYYRKKKQTTSLSHIGKCARHLIMQASNKGNIVDMICYCIMPTHIHLVLKQLEEGGISKFMNNILNSYSHYFNIKHNRKGPLWEGRFKRVLVEDDRQLLHLTRYIHLNPSTKGIVKKPEEWPWSSYRDYIHVHDNRVSLCEYDKLLDIDAESYKDFVESRIFYQRELADIKKLLFD